MKLIETINNTALAVVALPSILEEYREIKREIHYTGMRHVRYSKMVGEIEKRNKRIAELEIEVRKLLEANHWLALERDRLQSEVARLSAPGVVEQDIPQPEVGDGWEFCGKDEATEYTCRTGPGHKWCKWCEMSFYHEYNLEYRFRRPVAKPAPKWLACTAEEAEKSAQCEWLCNGDWVSLDCHIANWMPLNRYCTYRTTAPLPLEIAVPKSVWDRAPANARRYTARTDIGSLEWFLTREKLPDGFRLDAP